MISEAKSSEYIILMALLGAFSVLLLGDASNAQSQERSFSIDEIVVTARKRDESFQDVPAALTVLDMQTIERANLDTPMDVARLIPNVFMTQDTNFGDTQLFLRGALNVKDSESTFAFIVDGVQQANPNSFNRQLFELEQIEVVKGPQNALYGRNAIGGAVIISTRQPSDQPRGFLELTMGNGPTVHAQAGLSGPISRNLLGSAALSYFDTDGHLTNDFTGNKVDFLRNLSFQGRIIATPVENLTLDLRTQLSDVEGGAINFAVQIPPFTGSELNTNDTSIPFRANVRPLNDQTRQEVSLKADYATSFANFTLIAQWDDLDEEVGSDGAVNVAIFAPGFVTENGLPLAGFSSTPNDGTQYQQRNQRNRSLEFRIASLDEMNSRLRWLAGAYFLDADREVLLNTGLDTGPGVIVRAPVSGVDSVNPTSTLLNSFDENSTIALFGQLQFDITDDLEFALAARWEQEDRTNTNLVPDILSPASILQGSPRPLTGFPGLVRERKFNELTPRASLRYNLSSNLSLFTSLSRGFRSGGFNPSGSASQVAQFDDPTTTLTDQFDKETADSLEIGFKATLLNQRLQLNGAAFYTETGNAHFLKFFPVSIVRAVQIIEEVEQKGVELDWRYLATQNFTFFGNVGVLETDIKKNTEAVGTEGNTLPFSPDFTLNLGVDYERNVTSELTFFSRWDYALTGPIEFDTSNTLGTARGSVGLVNAGVGLMKGNQWNFSIWSKNLFNKRYNGVGIPVGGAINFIARAQPVTYGASFRYSF